MSSGKFHKMGRVKLCTLPSCIRIFWKFLAACLLFFTFNAFASEHPIEIKQYSDGMAYADESYVSNAGQFKRADGGVVKAYREEMSTAMAMPAGTACWLVLPDGTGIRTYKLLATCLLQTKDNVAELYWFNSSSPLASRVQEFDGYSFVDVTTLGKRWFSFIIHLRTYLVQYLATILGFAVLALRVGKWITFKQSSTRRWLAVKWGVGLTVLLTTIFFILVLVILFRSQTFIPMACFSILTVGFVLYWHANKLEQRRRRTQEA